MKIVCLLTVLSLLLCGCGAEMTMETVQDTLEVPAAATEREVTVELPGEAAAPAMESGSSRYYICDEYEISMENFPSGDLQETVRKLSGYDLEDLTVVKTEQSDFDRYDFVWASQEENGQRLGRSAILDDGHYHYTLTVMRDAEPEETSQVVWRTVFESFSLA